MNTNGLNLDTRFPWKVKLTESPIESDTSRKLFDQTIILSKFLAFCSTFIVKQKL